MTYRAVVDPNSCSGHGDCVDVAPAVFRLDDEIAEVIGDGPIDLIMAAAEACPASAISVVEVETGDMVYP